MASIKLPLNEVQQLAIPGIVKKINRGGGFLTASVLENTLIASSPFQKDLKLLQEELRKNLENMKEDNICDFCGVLPKSNHSNYCNACKHENLS